MKRITIICFAVAMVSALAIAMHNISTSSEAAEVNLAEVEALSMCEVSSIASQNTGYCTRLNDSYTEVCVEKGDPDCVRCKTTILL